MLPVSTAVIKRRGVVADGAGLSQHGRNQQIFGPRVRRALKNIQILFSFARAGHRQCGLADARLAGDPWRQGQVAFIDDQPAGQQLFENFPVPDPLLTHRHGLRQMEGNALDGERSRSRRCVRWMTWSLYCRLDRMGANLLRP